MNSPIPPGETAARLGALIEALPDAVFFKDGGGRWRILNGSALALFGLEGLDWEGRTDLELAAQFPAFADVFRTCQRHDEAAWAARGRYDSVETVPARDGGIRLFEVVRIPLFHGDGSRRGLVVVGSDVTERRRVEEANRRQRDSLRRLNEIAAHTHLPLTRQLHEALSAGCAQFGLELGVIGRIEGQRYVSLAQVGPGDTPEDSPPVPVAETYCSMVLAEGEIVAITHMSESPRRDHPCLQRFGLETYLGAPVIVDGAVYGAVGFGGRAPYARPFDDGDREFVHLLGRWIGSAIEREQVAEELAASELQRRTVVESEPDCVMLLTEDGRISQINRSGTAMLGAERAADLIGHAVLPLVTPEYRAAFQELTLDAFAGRTGALEFAIITQRGEHRWLETNSVPMRDTHGTVTAQLAITRDITARKAAEAEIEHLAYYDALTDLPNRRLFGDRLKQAMAQVQRKKQSLAVLFIDLDHFKTVNDTHGHDIGDLLLIDVAGRLRGAVRDSDTIARFGGDEFVILAQTTSADDAAVIAQKVFTTLIPPVRVAGLALSMTPSIGIASIGAGEEVSGRDLLKEADIALYAAKAGGRNTFRCYGET